MSQQLSGKTVIITGAAGGLGRAFALGFAAEGANLVIADMNEDGAAETVLQVEAAKSNAIAVALDVADKSSCEAMARAAIDTFGTIDVLVNNAAIYATLERSNFWEIDPQEWDTVMAVNVKGPWLASSACYKHMNHGGSIINVASATFFSGSPLWMHYVASKGALIGMTRVMAREAGVKDITVNAIAPGFTLTEASVNQIDDAANYGISSRSIKRASQPEDIVGTALFLSSERARYMTGQTLIVDGGKQFI